MRETLILCRSTQVLLIIFTDEHFHFFPSFPYDVLMPSCNFSHSVVNLNGDTSRAASALTHSSQDAYIYSTSQRTPCQLMPGSKGYETNACVCVFLRDCLGAQCFLLRYKRLPHGPKQLTA